VPVGKWIVPVAALAIGLAMAAATAHAEDDTNTPDFPTTVFADGARSASVTVGDVTAMVRMLRGQKPDPNDQVWLRVRVKGQPVAEAYGPDDGFDVPDAEASIAEVDPTNHYPEVVFSAYTGGAHCCTKVIVAEEQPHQWVTLDIGEFDGGGDYLQDVDHDGLAEIVTVDNRFLYTFDCYACSAAPLVIYTVRQGTVMDVSQEPRYLPAHRDWLAQLNDTVDPAERWTSPGFLAGWVAAKVRVGEGADAWAALKAHWDYAHDEGEETCLSGHDVDACPKDQLKVLKFPDRLKLFLDRNGYAS
jgi:hypothetical protein